MASSLLTVSSLIISYRVGSDDEGKDKFREQTFPKVSGTLTDEQLIQFSDKIDDLLDYNISNMQKQATYILSRI